MSHEDRTPQPIEQALAAFLDRLRPPERVRPQFDLGGRVAGRTVELFEIRSQWDEPKRSHRYPVAKATWVQSQAVWKVFCQCSDLKWEGYAPRPTVATINEFFEEVERDRHGCFFG
jgi:hypothetical protein